MGNWYTNVSLKDVNPSDVLLHLNELGRNAIITPAADGWLVVYDQECEKFDLDLLESLALTLSTHLQCTAIPCFNADDDIFWLAIYEYGRRVSRYASAVEEFEDRTEFPPVPNFAAEICRIFEKPGLVHEVRSVLRRSRGFLGLFTLAKFRLAYVVEIQRHQDLAALVGLPMASVGLGYEYVKRGELAPGMHPDTLLRTSSGNSI